MRNFFEKFSMKTLRFLNTLQKKSTTLVYFKDILNLSINSIYNLSFIVIFNELKLKLSVQNFFFTIISATNSTLKKYFTKFFSTN